MKTLIEWEPEPEPVVETGPWVIVAWGKTYKGYINGTEANDDTTSATWYEDRQSADAAARLAAPSSGGPYKFFVRPLEGAPKSLGGWERRAWPKRIPHA